MFSATRRWLRRNRAPIAIGLGVVGAGYVVTQYVLSKINDARERMSSDRIAKENLRRRFEQNQEDCTFTVLALLPTATTNILEAINTEKITYEIQQMKGSSAAAKLSKNVGSKSPPTMSETNATDDDGRSMISLQSESGVHASQITMPPTSSQSSAGVTTTAPGPAGGNPEAPGPESVMKPRKTKRQLWDDLTISSITRAYTLIYTLALLTLLTRIQLNLLGRRSYLSSVVSLATGSAQATINMENNDDDDDNPEHAYGSDFEINRKYLTFSWWLLNRGWVDIMQRVEAAVREIFGHLSPRDTLTLETFSTLTSQARRRIEGGGVPGDCRAGTNWLRFLLPPADMEEFVLRESGILDENHPSAPKQQQQQQQPQVSSSCTDPTYPTTTTTGTGTTTSLRRLLDETADLIESPSFSHVLTLLLDAGFSVLLNKKLTLGAFDLPPPPAPGMLSSLDVLQPTGPPTTTTSNAPAPNKAVLLPKVLSVLTRQAHAIGNGMPNEYLQEMETVRDLEAFAAVVYSSNWESEIHPDEEGGFSATRGAGGRVPPAPVQHHPGRGTVRQSQVSTAGGEESLIVVDPNPDPSGSFESAWERAIG